MSTTNPTEGQSEATKDSSVKASESETSIQIQIVDAETVPEPAATAGSAAASEDPAPAADTATTEAAADQAEQEQQPLTEQEQQPLTESETAAAEQTPTEQTPTEQTPTEQTPTEEAPTEETLAEETPTEETPTEEAPTEETPTEETPTEEAPTEEAPTEAEGDAGAEVEGEAGAEATSAPAGDTPAEAAPAATPAAAAAATTPASAAVDSAGKSRATRSRNPAFAAKQKNFIKDYRRSVGSAPVAGEKRSGSGEEVKKRRKSEEPAAAAAGGGGVALNDNYCWVCHREGKVVCCETCPRVFHLKCAQLAADPPGDWVCVECRRVVQAETVDNLSPAMKMLTHEQFTLLLKHAIGRLKGLPGAEPFITPVDEAKFPNYGEFVSCPMDLNTMEENINRGQYGSTEAFIADCKWILHNCILFNGQTSKLTALAKSLLRMCKWEMEEIETCPDCYSNAYLSDDWFTLACPHPHMLIWARLKGFPYWPAKAVKSRDGNVDCRFFGRHDRAWVPIKECYLFSKDPPSPPKSRSKSLDACIEELEEHIHNLEQKFGKFVHAKSRTVYDPRKITQHIKQMLPSYECNIVRPDQELPKRKRAGSELQLDKLEKLRQQKKARRSGPAASPQQPRQETAGAGTGAAVGAAAATQGGQQPGPGAPGGPPDLQAELDDEELEPDEDELEEDMEELDEEMDELEEEEPMEQGTPKAAKPARKSQGKPPAAAASSPAVKPAVTAAKPAAAAAAAKAAPAPATPAAKAAQSSAAPAAAQTAARATPAAGTKPVAKAAVQSPMTAVKVLQKGTLVAAAAAAVPVKSPRPGALAAAQLAKMGAASPASAPATPRPMAFRAAQGRPRLNQGPVRSNGIGSMSPAIRPRLMQQQQQQQRSPAGLLSPAAARAAAATARSVAVAAATDSSFVVSTPSRVGPMMIVPGSGITVSNGALGAAVGPAEGATAGEAPLPPVHTGAVSEQLRTQANDLSELIRSGLEKAISDLTQSGAPPAALANLRLQLERLQWRHQMELSEQKKVTDTMLAELRNSMEIEQKKTVNKLTTAFASERSEWSRLTELKVAETKKKQWCATCGREAIFYCCWNTSYCDFPCQEAQWPKHMLTCANQQSTGGQPAAADGAGDQQQQQQEQQQPQQQLQQAS